MQSLVGVKGGRRVGVQDLLGDWPRGLARRRDFVFCCDKNGERVSHAASTVGLWFLLAARESATSAVTMASMIASTSPIVKRRVVLRRRRIRLSCGSTVGAVFALYAL